MVGARVKIAVAAGMDEAHLVSWTSGGGYDDVPKTKKWETGGERVDAGSDTSGGGTNCSRRRKAGVVDARHGWECV